MWSSGWCIYELSKKVNHISYITCDSDFFSSVKHTFSSSITICICSIIMLMLQPDELSQSCVRFLALNDSVEINAGYKSCTHMAIYRCVLCSV